MGLIIPLVMFGLLAELGDQSAIIKNPNTSSRFGTETISNSQLSEITEDTFRQTAIALKM
jgi:hypothetical protein